MTDSVKMRLSEWRGHSEISGMQIERRDHVRTPGKDTEGNQGRVSGKPS